MRSREEKLHKMSTVSEDQEHEHCNFSRRRWQANKYSKKQPRLVQYDTDTDMEKGADAEMGKNTQRQHLEIYIDGPFVANN